MQALDEKWMRHVLKRTKQAQSLGEVPIAAILVKDDELISEAWNQPITNHDPTSHAEILALRKAATLNQNYRLPDTTLYVNLEPCLMCYGALVNARVKRLVFGASDNRFGVVNQIAHLKFNHQITITAGVLQDQCAQILSDFFKQRRKATSIIAE